MNELVQEILKGSYDLHTHAAPDATVERRMDALETARRAYEAEMSGFVLKSHDYPTAPLAYALSRMYPGLTVTGSIALNRAVGGLNPAAVEASAKLGARVVWMPTFDAHFYLTERGQGPGIWLTDDSGDLLSAVHQILDVVVQHDMVLASGHVSPSEALATFRAAKSRGVLRMIATHPTGLASEEEQRQMVSLGAYIEHTFLSCMPSFGRISPEQLVNSVRSFGVKRCVVTSDFGQWTNPPPAEGMRMAIAALLEAGMEPEDVSSLVKGNPLELIGITPVQETRS